MWHLLLHASGSGSMFGLQRCQPWSMRAAGSALCSGSAVVTAGPQQHVVEAGVFVEGARGHGVSNVPEHLWGKRHLETAGWDRALLCTPGRWLGGEFCLCWACSDRGDKARCR